MSQHDDVLQYIFADEIEGSWINGLFYTLLVKEDGTTERIYKNIPANKAKICNPSGNNGLEIKIAIENGKPCVSTQNVNFKKLVISPSPEIIPELQDLNERLNGQWYDLHSFVCSSINGKNPFDRGQCTSIGSRISNSLLRVASSRIFEYPEQFIAELVANSIDSYAEINNQRKIGKFGMGFLSILYFIIGNPDAKLDILTTVFDKTYNAFVTTYLRIMEIDGTLKVRFNVLNTCAQITGTLIRLENAKGLRPSKHISSLERLKFTESNPIFIDNNAILNNTRKFTSNDIGSSFIKVGYHRKNKFHYIDVFDRAGGMSFDVVLKSLLVPSISTKSISLSNVADVSFVNKSDIFDSDEQTFFIVVNTIVIVALNISPSKGHSIKISLPAHTRLPVARDDVIIKSVEKEFRDSLLIIFKQCLQKRTILEFENGLEKYIAITKNDFNRVYVSDFIKEMYHLVFNKIVCDMSIAPVYDKLGISYIIGKRLNLYANEQALLKTDIKYDENVFVNKKTVIADVQNITSAGTLSFLFIPTKMTEEKNWINTIITSYQDDFLISVEDPDSDIAKKKFQELNISEKIMLNPWKESIYSLISVYLNIFTQRVDADDDTQESLLDIAVTSLINIFNLGGGDTMVSYISKFITMISTNTPSSEYGTSRRRMVYAKYQVPILVAENNNKRMFFEWLDLILDIGCRQNKKYTKPLLLSFHGINMVSLVSSKKAQEYLDKQDTSIGEYIFANHILRPFAKINRILDLLFERGFMEKIRDVYGRYVNGRTDDSIISSTEWTIGSVYSVATNDVNLWISVQQEKLNIESINLDLGFQRSFTTKQLINHVFNNEVIDFNRVKEESHQIPLQIIEISVNAGTSKPFIPSILTELFQNAMDAIRLSENSKQIIEISISEMPSSNYMAVSVKDYVGMNMDNIISMSIPFYSNKKPSKNVTGEMGTGFFNIYRESDYITVKTCKDASRIDFIQKPIRDIANGVVDIDTDFKETKNSEEENGTTITSYIKYENQTESLHLYNQVRSFAYDIAPYSDVKVKFNGVDVIVKKVLIYEDPTFECFYAPNLPISYVYTNNIPYQYLYEFVNDYRAFIPESLIDAVSSNLIINLKSGMYVPLQSRTSVRIIGLEKVDFAAKLCKALGIQVLYFLSTETDDGSNIASMRYNSIFISAFQFSSNRGDLRQMLTRYSPLYTKITPLYQFMASHVFIENTKSFQEYIKQIVSRDLVPLEISYEMEMESIDKLSKTLPPLHELQLTALKNCIKIWFAPKLERRKKAEIKVVEKSLPRSDVNFLKKMVTNFINLFTETANTIKPRTFTAPIKTKVIKMPPDLAGFYSGEDHSISINATFAENVPEFKSNLAKFKKKGLTALRMNKLFIELFSLSVPSSVVVHELEHARRRTTHTSQGAHQDIIDSIFGGPKRNYNFTESSNEVYNNLCKKGLIDKWLNSL